MRHKCNLFARLLRRHAVEHAKRQPRERRRRIGQRKISFAPSVTPRAGRGGYDRNAPSEGDRKFRAATARVTKQRVHETPPSPPFPRQSSVLQGAEIIDSSELLGQLPAAILRSTDETKARISRRDWFEGAQEQNKSFPVRWMIQSANATQASAIRFPRQRLIGRKRAGEPINFSRAQPSFDLSLERSEAKHVVDVLALPVFRKLLLAQFARRGARHFVARSNGVKKVNAIQPIGEQNDSGVVRQMGPKLSRQRRKVAPVKENNQGLCFTLSARDSRSQIRGQEISVRFWPQPSLEPRHWMPIRLILDYRWCESGDLDRRQYFSGVKLHPP